MEDPAASGETLFTAGRKNLGWLYIDRFLDQLKIQWI